MSSPQETSANADELALEECIGQLLLTWDRRKIGQEHYDHAMGAQKCGSLYNQLPSVEEALELKEMLRKNYPDAMLSGDLVYGAGAQIAETTVFPQHMAMGACGDPEKIREVGRYTAEQGRYYGFSWNFAPVVDLMTNPNNPCLNTRAFGEKADHVLRMATAFIEGCQENGRMAACAKHFPGDGVDDRDQHYGTTVNSLSRDEWWATFGKVWRGVIDAGVESIMIGHIALPWMDPGKDWRGAPPATASYPIITELLRNELGYDGVILSDAMIMAGITNYIPRARIAVEFIKAGGDVVLVAYPEDHEHLLEAVRSGEIPESQIRASADRVLRMKSRLGLLYPETAFYDVAPSLESLAEAQSLSSEIASEAVKVLRDATGQLPLQLPKGAKVAVVNVGYENPRPGHNPKRFAERLREEGFDVTETWNNAPCHPEELGQFQQIFLNTFVSGQCKPGGTIRLSGDATGWLFRSFIGEEVPTIMSAFGCPYKIRELAAVSACINAHSCGDESQDAVIDVILGKAAGNGKSPVSLDGFFDCDYE